MKKILFFIVVSCITFSYETKGQCILPESIPNNPTQLEQVNRDIAECYAPEIWHIAEASLGYSANGRADLITSVYFDGDLNTGNNWENLENYKNGPTLSHDELDPVVYYSVVWTNYAWFISYTFYHPRDYAENSGPCCYGFNPISDVGDIHENDMEGAVIVVSRIDDDLGGVSKYDVMGTYTVAHHDLEEFSDFNEVPTILIDNATHAVSASLNTGPGCIQYGSPCDDCVAFDGPKIKYTLSTNGDAWVNANPWPQNTDLLSGSGKYLLEDIFGSHSTSLASQRTNQNVFTNGLQFFMEVINPSNPQCQDEGGLASAPWAWSQITYDDDELKNLLFTKADEAGFFKYYDTHGMPYLVENNPYNDNQCGFNQPPMDYSYSGGQVYFLLGNTPTSALNSIHVTNNSKLYVFGTHKMNPYAHIIVEPGSEIIFDNVILEPCNPGVVWQGITAYEDAKITFKESELRGAIIGFNYLGGSSIRPSILNIESNSIIEECGIGVRIQGTSICNVNDAFLNNNNTGIHCIESMGPTINNTIFTRNNEAIRSIESMLIVGGNNEFIEGQIGISVEGTYPLGSSIDIGNSGQDFNLFQGDPNASGPQSNQYSLVCSGAEGGIGINVVNNSFQDVVGIEFIGSNELTFNNNTVNNSLFGANCVSTGANPNDLNCNSFQIVDFYGIIFSSDNQESSFLENHFASSEIDVALFSAKINSDIGNGTNSASNCFSTNGLDIISGNLWNIPSETFNYSYFDDTSEPIPCQIPSNPVGFTHSIASTEGNYCDQTIGIFNFIDPDEDGVNGIKLDELDPFIFNGNNIKDSINHYVQEVVLLGGDDPRTPQDDSGTPLAGLEENIRILDDWINFGLYISIVTSNHTLAFDILTPLLKWKWQKRLFGMKIIDKNYSGAQIVLNQLETLSQDQVNFKLVQEINMKRFLSPEGEGPVIIQDDLDTLLSIINSKTPSKGYAKSLYRLLTGNNIIDEIPIMPESNSKESLPKEAVKLDFDVFPNPGSNIIEISTDNIEYIVSGSIYDVVGNKLKDFDYLEGSNVISIDDLPNGIMYVVLYSEKGEKYIKKILIQK